VAIPASTELLGKHILLGVCGGIAAYKTPTLVRLLRKEGADVQVVMTRSAAQFVSAISLQAVSGRPVRDDLWDSSAEAAMGHIELARWADLILIAPATADCLSRLAQGRADDLLTTVCLASRAPQLLAPAMNNVMWDAAATRRNLTTLQDDGAVLLGPDSGDQACGETGPGRMQEPEVLTLAVKKHLRVSAGSSSATLSASLPQDAVLTGKRVVITAGPTREALDPVRFISNHSSGKQGYAFAEAARDLGAQVTLISGPVHLPRPDGVDVIDVVTALDMHRESLRHAAGCDLFVAVAAVADYRPHAAASQKIKKNAGTGGSLQLELIENPDIVASVAAMADRPVVVIGFAAETEKAQKHGRDKLARKKLDAIVVNDVSGTETGFNSDDNAAALLLADANITLARQSKYSLATRVILEICRRFEAQLARTNPEDLAN